MRIDYTGRISGNKIDDYILTLTKISETEYTFTYSYKDDDGKTQTANGSASYSISDGKSTIILNKVEYTTIPQPQYKT